MKRNIPCHKLLRLSFLLLFYNFSSFAKADAGIPADDAPVGVRFKVENVKIPKEGWDTENVEDAFLNKTLRSVYYLPEEHKNAKVIDFDNTENVLLGTVRRAYYDHFPLVLSPDEIWLTICQGMAIHINQNFKEFESIIYKNGHPNVIAFRNDKLDQDKKAWKDLIDSISAQTIRYTGQQFYDAFVTQFSTTTPIEQTAYQITLLDAQKNAYSYIAESGCGIPYVTLRGTTADWIQIKKKLSILDTLNMKKWKSCLEPIIDQFIKASRGKADAKFWAKIYKDKTDYDAYSITGWIHQLFPYIVEREYAVGDNVFWFKEVYLPNPFLDKKVKSSDSLTSNKFPKGISMVPIVWENRFKNETKKLRLYSGFVGVKQYKDLSLEPFISWAICEEKQKYDEEEDDEQNGNAHK